MRPASGTWGSAAGLAIFLIPGFERWYVLAPAIVVFFIYGVFVGDKFEEAYGEDPAECTVDEVVGMWISLIAVPKTIPALAFAFVVWRALDILKPPPARQAESIEGGMGVMLDDVISAIYALGIVHAAIWLTDNFAFVHDLGIL
ncbi:MAG: phosphatidylglycerophosphatase A [Ignavibacteriales bacterium]|nr:phosphatidylglycerophosphatase A [Ignavibacteriales bacterium]